MDISFPAIRCILYGRETNVARVPLTPVFDYWWDMVKGCHFQRSRDLKESTKRWISQRLFIDGEGADWVLDTKGLIKNTNLTFAAMFFWLLVHHRLSPTAADNILTWDRTVLVAALVEVWRLISPGC